MDGPDAQTWRRLLRRSPADAGVSSLYGPLLEGARPGQRPVLGRIAQSLDGRIATATGASRWISGPDDIIHTHRLRALFDAVVVGAGDTGSGCGPTTRRRPRARWKAPRPCAWCWTCTVGSMGAISSSRTGRRRCCCAPRMRPDRLGQASVVRLPRAGVGLCLNAVLAAQAARGLRRVLAEGGGVTVSRFLAAGVLDRLQVTIAPLLLGDGVPSFRLSPAGSLEEALCFDWTVHRLDADLLLDIPLRRAAA